MVYTHLSTYPKYFEKNSLRLPILFNIIQCFHTIKCLLTPKGAIARV